QKKLRVDLEASAQGVQHAARHVPFCVATQGCLGSIHGHIKQWVIEGLLDPRVHHAGNLFHLPQELIGNLSIALDIASVDLDVDRRGETKVQDLSHDVRGEEGE